MDCVNHGKRQGGSINIVLGSFSSRVTVFAGNATKNAASEMKKILLSVAAGKLEANPHDLEARGGRINIRGNPDKGITVSETIKAYLAYKKEPFLGYTLPTAMDNPPTTPIIVEANDKEIMTMKKLIELKG